MRGTLLGDGTMPVRSRPFACSSPLKPLPSNERAHPRASFQIRELNGTIGDPRVPLAALSTDAAEHRYHVNSVQDLRARPRFGWANPWQ